MDYSFIRKVVKNVSETDVKKLYQTLISNGIEVFVKKDDEYCNMTMEHFAGSGDLYVSAADLEHAKELVQGIGLEENLCNDAESRVDAGKSELEKAEEEFYRKHRQNQIFAWVIIIGVVAFMVIQFFVK